MMLIIASKYQTKIHFLGGMKTTYGM